MPKRKAEVHSIPATMQAAVYRGRGRVCVEKIPVPEIGRNEVLVRVHACGVCHTDLKKIQYDLLPPPRVFGHETAGVIVKTGSGVKTWTPGDRVAVFHHIPCMRCLCCKRRDYAQCEGYKRTGTSAGFEPAGGGFAQYLRVMPWIVKEGMVRIPQNISYEEASFLEPANTCMKAVQRLDPKKGETVSIYGQGPIGLIFTQLIALQKAKVRAFDLLPSRRALALKMGAQEALDPRRRFSRPSATKTKTAKVKGGLDAAILAVPSEAAFQHALESLRPGGRMLLFAHTKRIDTLSVEAARICVDEITLLGSYSSSVDVQPDVSRLIFSRKLKVAPLVTHRYPLSQIQKAIERASRPSRQSLKVLVAPCP